MTGEMIWPDVKGSLRPDVPLSGISWFRVGGPALALFQPADRHDLAHFLQSLPDGMPIMTIGVASNLLIRDGGVDGAVIRLGGKLAAYEIKDDLLTIGAGALDQRAAQIAARAGLSGIEFMIGIPGTIGGAVAMNAGAFGGETAERLEWVEVMLRDGCIERLPQSALSMSYRKSQLPEGGIVLSAAFRLEPSTPDTIKAKMASIKAEREAAQPLRVATGGSTFKNPPLERAWQLIDRAGCRGLRHGHASVSQKHCNFLINDGESCARELEELGELVKARVLETTDIELEWEIRRIGKPASIEGRLP